MFINVTRIAIEEPSDAPFLINLDEVNTISRNRDCETVIRLTNGTNIRIEENLAAVMSALRAANLLRDVSQ